MKSDSSCWRNSTALSSRSPTTDDSFGLSMRPDMEDPNSYYQISVGCRDDSTANEPLWTVGTQAPNASPTCTDLSLKPTSIRRCSEVPNYGTGPAESRSSFFSSVRSAVSSLFTRGPKIGYQNPWDEINSGSASPTECSTPKYDGMTDWRTAGVYAQSPNAGDGPLSTAALDTRKHWSAKTFGTIKTITGGEYTDPCVGTRL
jgi:hypothetical protein